MSMSAIDIEGKKSEYYTQAGRTKNRLERVTALIAEGRAPSTEQSEDLLDGLAELRKLYDNIFEYTKANVYEHEAPAYGCPIEDCFAALSSTNKHIIEAARQTLTDFISVKATHSACEDALKPYLNSAAALEEYLSVEAIENSKAEIEAARAFLTVLESGDVFGPEMEQISKYYPNNVQYGLAGGKYFMKRDKSGDKQAPDSPFSDPEPMSPQVHDNQPDSLQDSVLSEPESEESKTQAAAALDTIPAAAIDTAPARVLDTPLAAALDTPPAMPDENPQAEAELIDSSHDDNTKPAPETIDNTQPPEQPSKFLTADNAGQIKPRSAGASTFKNDITKLARAHHTVRDILPMLAVYNTLTKDMLYYCGANMFENDPVLLSSFESDLIPALNALCNKGYIAAFTFEEDGVNNTAYCLSEYCALCMNKQSVACMDGFWAIKPPKNMFYSTGSISENFLKVSLSVNYILINYKAAMKAAFGRRAPKIDIPSFDMENGDITLSVFDEEGENTCRVIETFDDNGSQPSEDLLFAAPIDELPTDIDIPCRKLFAIYNKTFMKFDHENKVWREIRRAPNGSICTVEFVPPFDIAQTDIESEDIELEGIELEDVELEDIELTTPNETIPDDEPARYGQPYISTNGHSLPAYTTEYVPLTKTAVTYASNATADKSGNIIKDYVTSPQGLLNLKSTPDDVDFYIVTKSILYEKQPKNPTAPVMRAVLFGACASLEKNTRHTKALADKLKLATSLMTESQDYSGDNLSCVFSDTQNEDEALLLSAYMLAMLTPAIEYDHTLNNSAGHFLENYEQYFPNFPEFKRLFNKMTEVADISPAGFSQAVTALLNSGAQNKNFADTLKTKAKELLNPQTPKARMAALPKMYKVCFGPGSPLHDCMSAIAAGKSDDETIKLVEKTLSEYCDNQNGSSREKIEERIDREWDKANTKGKFKLENKARGDAIKDFGDRIKLMRDWLEHMRSTKNIGYNITQARKLRDELLGLISEAKRNSRHKTREYENIVQFMLDRMQNRLNGTESEISTYGELLFTGFIGLNAEYKPDIDESLANIKYYEPWRNALRHITAKIRPYQEIVTEILGGAAYGADDALNLKDNLNQLMLLGKLLQKTDDDFNVTPGQLKDAKKSADANGVKFEEKLELAYMNGRIGEEEKETLSAIMTNYRPAFYRSNDFACWRRFLAALELQIDDFCAMRGQDLKAKLDERLQKNEDSPLLAEAGRMLENKNFAVAEEYLNRFDSGETVLDESDAYNTDLDYFDNFISEANFEKTYSECVRHKSTALNKFGWHYVDRKLPEYWTARNREDSRNLIMNWPSGIHSASTEQIKVLFTGLGFDVTGVEKAKINKGERFRVYAKPQPRSMSDYRHPISAFGTELRSPIDVIVLYGNCLDQELIDTITKLNLGRMSIVLVDSPITAAQRRSICEKFHKTSGLNPFLLIDRVLLLYLAMQQRAERLPALLKCALPYTTSYQPFVEGGGSITDDMFCGRKAELSTIIDPNGACLLYGGRQLGKTALLERAESRCSDPQNKAYAVYSIISSCDNESDVTSTLISSIDKKTNGKIKLNGCKTLKQLCDSLGRMFRSGEIKSMHLFIDESDRFLEAIAADAYEPLHPLVDLKRETKNNFKFVLAGLHNVCRAENATKNNGIFGQLGRPLCIEPLSPKDALTLLSRPLSYLGFKIDKDTHLETILTNTNYYPGILQLFGYDLVNTLANDYPRYYSATRGNPPFTLRDEQLGAVINSSKFNNSVKDKFRLSLQLDERYYMLARCITWLYHYHKDDTAKGSWHGFSVKDIIEAVELFDIYCLKNANLEELTTLLDEMTAMGILNQPKENPGRYRLRRNSFVDLIGKDPEALEAEIEANNAGGRQNDD